jgi:ribokinase
MANILVIGSANTDMVVKTQRFPVPGETIVGGDFYMFAGGKGANQAVAAARMGGDVTFICKVGNDIFGKQAITGFEKEGINTQYAFTDTEKSSGVALITVNGAGENSIVVASGANAALSPEDIEQATQSFETSDIILTQLETPVETVAYIVEKAAILNKKVILNPAPAQILPDSVYQNLFLITPNETEAALLTGLVFVNEASLSHIAETLLSKGIANVLITLGSKGAYFHNSKQHFIVPTPKVKALDTTAAGDVFNGALAVALAEGLDWKTAITTACQAGAISVTRMGAQTSAPYRDEIPTLYI